MDHIRQELDQLMGKDRNKPLFVRLARRDHFDDNDVSLPKSVFSTGYALDIHIDETLFHNKHAFKSFLPKNLKLI